jgi:ribonuclease R
MYARAAHFELPDEPTRHDIQLLLDAARETPAARAIHFAVLRTFSKASYSPAAIGHFALASDHYAHFTSPIRRYPDLTQHRAMQAFLEFTDNGRKPPGGRKRHSMGRRLLADERVPNEGELIELGRHCSDTEIEAEQAERELRAFLVMQFLLDKHLGDTFPGVITGVTRAGVFVSIERFLVEGLVKMTEMPGASGRPDRWNVDESTGRLVAQRSGASLGIGDIVEIKIAGVDLASRHLDLMLMSMPQRAPEEAPDGRGVKGHGRGRDRRGKKGRKRGSIDGTDPKKGGKKRGKGGGGKSSGDKSRGRGRR